MNSMSMKLIFIGCLLSILSGCVSTSDLDFVTSYPKIVQGGQYNPTVSGLTEAQRLAVKYRILPNELVSDKKYFALRHALLDAAQEEYKRTKRTKEKAQALEVLFDLMLIKEGAIGSTLIKDWSKEESDFINFNGVKVAKTTSALLGLHVFIEHTPNCGSNCASQKINAHLGQAYINYMDKYVFKDGGAFVEKQDFANTSFYIWHQYNGKTHMATNGNDGNTNVQTLSDGKQYQSTYPEYQRGKLMVPHTLANTFLSTMLHAMNYNAEFVKVIRPTLKNDEAVFIPIQRYIHPSLGMICFGGLFVQATGVHELAHTQCNNSYLINEITSESTASL